VGKNKIKVEHPEKEDDTSSGRIRGDPFVEIEW